MNKQFDFIQVEQNMEGIAVKQHNPILKFLKYALVGVAAFIALIILFAVGSTFINPAIDGAMQKLGLSDSIVATDASPVAYAWTSPYASGYDTNYQGNFSSIKDSNATTISYLRDTGYDSSASLVHHQVSGIPGDGGAQVNSSGDLTYTQGAGAINYKVLVYIDIGVDDAMRHAIKNKQLTELKANVTFSLNISGKNGGCEEGAWTYRVTGFLVSTDTSYASLDSTISQFPNLGAVSGSNVQSGTWGNSDNFNSSATYNLTLGLSDNITKIRLGCFVYLVVNARNVNGWVIDDEIDVKVPAPTLSLNKPAYTKGSMQLKVNTYDPNKGDVASIEGGTIIWKSRAVGSQSIGEINGAAFNVNYGTNYDLKAVPNRGYYFAGWGIASGGISRTGNRNYTLMEIPSGAYVSTNTAVVTAYFRPITLDGIALGDGEGPETVVYWDYKQDASGNAIAQGPTYEQPKYNANTGVEEANRFQVIGGEINASGIPIDRYVSGTLKKETYYSLENSIHSYGGNTCPRDAGSYIMVVRIVVDGVTGNEYAEVGYYYQKFTISAVNLEGYTVDEEIATYTFNNTERKPVPDSVWVSKGSDRYKLAINTDYTIGAYSNNQYVTAGGGSLILIATNKNFRHQVTAKFTINPLDISTLTATVKTAEDIQAKYGYNAATSASQIQAITYNGYQQRPNVIYVELKEGDTIYQLYRTNLFNNQKEAYGYTEGLQLNETYMPYFRIINLDIDEYGDINGSMNGLKAYKNNVNACTYNGVAGSSASFEIAIDSAVACSNLKGKATIYFNIATVDLSSDKVSYDYAIDPQSQEYIYNGSAHEIKPEVVYMTLSNQNIWVYNNDTTIFTQYSGYDVRFAFSNTDKPIAYSDEIKSNCGAPRLVNGRWEDYGAGEAGTKYFSGFVGVFTKLGTNVGDGPYQNNINVTRDAQGNVIAGAKLNFNFGSNEGATTLDVAGSATTMFTISPLDLSGAYNNGTIGFFPAVTNGALAKKETYTRERLTPTPEVQAYRGENSGTVLIADKDFKYMYPGDAGIPVTTQDNINVRKGGIVYAAGIGNYTGMISVPFTINPMVVDEKTAIADAISAVEYTGITTVHPLKEGDEVVFTINGDRVTLTVGVEGGNTGDFYSLGVTSTNKEVSPATEHKNYVSVVMMGNYSSSSELKLYFAIEPKDIGGENISATTNWSKGDYEQLIYNGGQFVYNALPGEKDKVGARDGHIVLTYSVEYGGSSTTHTLRYVDGINGDYDIIGGGTNTNVIDEDNNYITLEGIGNYKGTINVPIRILPRNISGTVENQITLEKEEGGIAGEYKFTGSSITPAVISVNYADGALTINGLKEGTNYTVSWGENIYVQNGGVVYINGIGNYTGSKGVAFSIKPIDQTVTFLNPSEQAENNGYLHPETSGYADYYINAFDDSSEGVLIVATTTAIYYQKDGDPTEIKMPEIQFVATDTAGKTTNKAIVTIEESKIVGDKLYTYARVKFNNAYGIVYIKATQTDPNGNYNYAEDSNTYSIYGMRQDSAEGLIDIQRVYGNPTEIIYPNFASGSKATISLASSDSTAVEVRKTTQASDNNHTFTLTYKKAVEGTVTITVSHPGYIGATKDGNGNISNDDIAYVPFSQSFTVSVAKRPLHISLEPLTIEYGVNPVQSGLFKFIYTTQGTVEIGGVTVGSLDDKATGLVNNNVIDDVITGHNTSYSSLDHSKVGYYDHTQIYVNYINATVHSTNYDITYGTGELTVTKKQLEVNVSMYANAPSNQIIREYGVDNIESSMLSYGYIGLVNQSDLIADSLYRANPVTINYVDLETNNPIDKYTPAGTYRITTTGGLATNYTFKVQEVTLVIKPASVIIAVESLTTPYLGKPIALTEDNVTITGVLGRDGNYELPKEGYTIRLEYIERQSNGNYVASSTWPENAGSYRVRVTFIPAEDVQDNYAETQLEQTNAITITKVAPNITYERGIRIQFSNTAINKSEIQVDIDGLASGLGKPPRNQYISEIWFAPTGTAPEGCESNNTYNLFFTEEAPSAIGKYDIICVYRAELEDNFTDLIVRFNSKVEITTGVPTLSIKQDTKTFTYTGKGCGLDIYDDFNDFTYKPYGGSTVVLDKSNSVVKYYVDGEWTTTAPKNAGLYNVLLVYTPTDSDAEQVGAEEREYPNAVEIRPLDLSIGADHIKLNYTGTRRLNYNAKGQPLLDRDVVILGVTGGTKPLGTVSLRYYKGGVEYAEPKAAGVYDVHITYHGVTGDNYTATDVKKFIGAIEIAKVGVTINMSNTYSVVYNGAGKAAEGAICHGVMLDDGTYEQPMGSLSYQYRKNGSGASYTSELPKAVGVYDVRISYVPLVEDNYANILPREFTKVITITKATPSIIIDKMTVSYGDVINVLYNIRGAQNDLNGPMNELANGVGRVTISYGTRFTTADGGAGYDWSTTPPTDSGKYSVRIDFTAGNTSNYISVSQTAFDNLTIENIKPTFQLNDKTVVYDGNRHNAGEAMVFDGNGRQYTKWDGVSSGKYYYRGTIGYEYRKVGSNTWTTLAPNAVGVYDVAVRYYENSINDVFSATVVEFSGVLTIEALEIKVMPIYGQGHIYNGMSTSGDQIAYVYSYMRDGYKYMVYSRVGDLDRNEVIDLSKAEYVDEDGQVYTIVTDASMLSDAWRDYYQKMVTLVSGSFMDGDELVTLNFADLGVTEGKGEFTAENGKSYVVDLDLDIVYIEDQNNYTLSTESGYYFSIIDGEGKVNVIEINTANIIYPTGDTTKGTYVVTIAGKQTLYSINLSAMTASANGEIYDIYRNIHVISYQKGSSKIEVKVDFSSFYYVSEDGKAIYKNSNGESFLIDINTSAVQKVAALSIDTITFDYAGYGNTQETVLVDTSAIEPIYSNNAYIGRYKEGNLEFIINLKAKTVRIQTFYILTINGNYYQFVNARGREMTAQANALKATTTKGVYTWLSGDVTYYLDTNQMIVREQENLFAFDVENRELYREVNGEKVAFSVDIRSLSYQVRRNDKLAYTTTLYGNEYDVENATLISGNAWDGVFSILAQGAGEYEISQGTFSIGANYSLSFIKGVVYSIERAKLTVSFAGDNDAIYDGENKFISYTIEGVLDNESIGVTQTYDGDNLNVTAGGYRTMITINSNNYYLEGGISDWYHIAPAEMAEIVVPTLKPIIYDGAKHYLELKDVERGATVSYAGSATAPYFVEPGTYSVIATVSKPNHISLEVELKLTIAKAKYEVVALEVPGTLKYGDALPTLLCDSNLGTIALDPTQVLLPNVTTYTWTFTPYSQEFYRFYEGNSADGNTITGTIELKVQKAQANIEITGELIQSEGSPSAIIGFANGMSTNESELVTIEYIAGDGTRYAKMPTDAGKYTVRITYAGDENYAETVYTTVLTIEQESNYEWLVYVGSAIGVLFLLSTVFFLVRKQKKFE